MAHGLKNGIVKGAAKGTKSAKNKMDPPTGMGFTAVKTDSSGNVEKRNGKLAPSSIEEAFKYGGKTGGIDIKSIQAANKKRRETPRGY